MIYTKLPFPPQHGVSSIAVYVVVRRCFLLYNIPLYTGTTDFLQFLRTHLQCAPGEGGEQLYGHENDILSC